VGLKRMDGFADEEVLNEYCANQWELVMKEKRGNDLKKPQWSRTFK